MATDYDKAYETLGLPFGAPLQDIETEWKLLFASSHPDRYRTGPYKEKATRRSQELNDARDQLRTWWNQNNCPPPSKKEKPKAKTKPNDKPKPSDKPKDDPPPQKPPDPKPKYDDPPEPPIQFGPPPFVKTAKHHFYDSMNFGAPPSARSENIAVIGGIFLLGAGLISIFQIVTVALQAVGLIFGIPLFVWVLAATEGGNPVPLIPMGLTIWIVLELFKKIALDIKLYKIQLDPYFKDSRHSANDALQKLTQVITGHQFQGKEWQLKEDSKQYTRSGKPKLFTKVYEIPSANPLKAPFRLYINIAPLNQPSGIQGSSSTICYWFEFDPLPIWNKNDSQRIIDTDKALWQSVDPPQK